MTDSQPLVDHDVAEVSVTSAADGERIYVTAFSRGLQVIRAFSGRMPNLSIADIAKATGLNRATARRFLHTLEADGYVDVHDGRYSLRAKVLELGYSYLSSVSVDHILQAQLLDLAETVRESCSAGVMEGHDVVFVARAQTSAPRVMTLALTVGMRVPAYLSAIGRVLLAELPDDQLEHYLATADLQKVTPNTIADAGALREELARVRQTGASVLDEEIETGVLAVAVPVHQANRPTLGVSVAAHASRVTATELEETYLPRLRETAVELERLLALRN